MEICTTCGGTCEPEVVEAFEGNVCGGCRIAENNADAKEDDQVRTVAQLLERVAAAKKPTRQRSAAKATEE